MDDAICVSRDAALAEQVQAAAAAVGRPVQVVRDPEAVRRTWRQARVVFVGVESAEQVARLGLASRPGLHLVGRDAAELARWSVPLGASVLVMPESVGLVSSLVTEQSWASQGTATVVRVVGGSGGLGVSTLAAGLAQAGARQGLVSALVDLDATGGGADFLVGAERAPGWRWHDLAAARGHLGELAGRLPRAADVDVVSHSQPGGEVTVLTPEATTAVVQSLARSHDLVVLDAAAGLDTVAEQWARCLTWVVVGADVRSVLAARRRATEQGWVDAEVVVRTGSGRRLRPQEVADAVGLPLAGTVPEDRRLPVALESGEPPARVARRPWSKACSALVRRAVAQQAAA